MSGPIDVFNLAIQQQMNKSRALQCTGLMLLLQSILYNYHLICSGACWLVFQHSFGDRGWAHCSCQSGNPATNEQVQRTAMHRVYALVKEQPCLLSMTCSAAYCFFFQHLFEGHDWTHRCFQSCAPATDEQIQSIAVQRANALL
jgi:hypothetical protein